MSAGPVAAPTSVVARAVSSPAAWTWVALATALAMGGSDVGASRYWWLVPALLAAFLAGWHTRRVRPVARGRIAATAVYLLGGAAGGVAFELALDAGGGLGGLHPDAVTSFLLLPGYLVPTAGFTLWAIRRHGLDTRRLFFLAGSMSWYEALTVGGPAMAGAPLLAPALIAFYLASYAVYNGALGMLLVDPAALHRAHPRSIGWARLLGLGVLGGAGVWVVFVAWSSVVL